MKTTASARPPSVQCRQSSVRLRTRAVAPETRMMFNWGSSRPFPSRRAAECEGRPPLPPWCVPRNLFSASFAPTRRWPNGPPAAIARKRSRVSCAGICRVRLALRIRIAEERNGQLELAADAGAIAAIVRQRSAELLTALKREGWEFTGIRVRVQVRTEPAPSRKPLANPVDRSALQPLSALARGLPDGPLKTALHRFLRRVG